MATASDGIVDCTDMARLLKRLETLRKADDSIILSLNDALPTKSFQPTDATRKQCQLFREQVDQLQRIRKTMIERCLEENRKRMNSEDAVMGRIMKSTIRQLEGELDIEVIVSNRSKKAVEERCSQL